MLQVNRHVSTNFI